ncbi:DUF1129 family protein [Tenuibacillus multivorans]|uniref:DNA-binding ferritin-like protein (Dps family) n=1 Tax=Tenuibacillus multivorans TaxID=237069 RepID=A0A1H0FKY2_9BACI|nr:DUF1129 family protein [Tenuibacillus multivorans]GEL77710.1 hypothetical protein TMU01_19450 [Tenuibacillus multivorans]SDN95345.1 Protein of unknown function [Tenuibacillus multivorans]
MNTKELIKANNDKRKLLTKETQKYYEDMLIYIRLSYDKSEHETEEILTEMLDHLLEAQEDGKTAVDVFGENPKQYADDIIGELPKIVTKKRIKYMGMGILYFLAALAILSALFNVVEHYLLDLNELTYKIYLGTQIANLMIAIPIAFLQLIVILHYLRWETFKNINKVLAFFIYWIFGLTSIGLFFVIIYFMPSFGPLIEWNVWFNLIIGVVLYVLARSVKSFI